ncbi:unnamed protein product [Chondrus crispus]|uniref:Uncharacterized protein n=1 Tax=Chondrus crispus TaxID=2769 RepID=R7Q317_CHOCR|nr:unnamed protein product [Chondrus crispus]CDF32293.1 unnamed protein product [Chondrus crispus]|eukprot:XP_005711958.1 unnamed protein product [Chondrus crispus]
MESNQPVLLLCTAEFRTSIRIKPSGPPRPYCCKFALIFLSFPFPRNARMLISPPTTCAPSALHATMIPPVPQKGSSTKEPFSTPAIFAMTNASSASMLVGPIYRRRLSEYFEPINPHPSATLRPRSTCLGLSFSSLYPWPLTGNASSMMHNSTSELCSLTRPGNVSSRSENRWIRSSCLSRSIERPNASTTQRKLSLVCGSRTVSSAPANTVVSIVALHES